MEAKSKRKQGGKKIERTKGSKCKEPKKEKWITAQTKHRPSYFFEFSYRW